MEQVMRRAIAEIMKLIGFEQMESNAMELLLAIHNDRLESNLRTITKPSFLCGRASVSLLDLFGMRQTLPRISNEMQFAKEMLEECKITVPVCKNRSIQSLFTLAPVKKQTHPIELLEEETEWISPLSTRVEKFIHIYDFMPEFPPIHTFRMTFIKSSAFKNQSSKVKNRLEQSLRSEGNMVKLIKSSGSMPRFINYLYKGKM